MKTIKYIYITTIISLLVALAFFLKEKGKLKFNKYIAAISSSIATPLNKKSDHIPIQSNSLPTTSSSFKLQIGGVEYPILFDDPLIPSQIKKDIVKDLMLNFSHFDYMSLKKNSPI